MIEKKVLGKSLLVKENVFNQTQYNMKLQVDCLVTTAGGVEEDLIKCMAPTYLGEFSLKGQELRSKGEVLHLQSNI